MCGTQDNLRSIIIPKYLYCSTRSTMPQPQETDHGSPQECIRNTLVPGSESIFRNMAIYFVLLTFTVKMLPLNHFNNLARSEDALLNASSQVRPEDTTTVSSAKRINFPSISTLVMLFM